MKQLPFQTDLAGPQFISAEMHDLLLRDLALLHESRRLLVERLERVVVALALTLDAQAAAEQRLLEAQKLAGAPRIGRGSAADWSQLAEKYRHVLHVLESLIAQARVEGESP